MITWNQHLSKKPKSGGSTNQKQPSKLSLVCWALWTSGFRHWRDSKIEAVQRFRYGKKSQTCACTLRVRAWAGMHSVSRRYQWEGTRAPSHGDSRAFINIHTPANGIRRVDGLSSPWGQICLKGCDVGGAGWFHRARTRNFKIPFLRATSSSSLHRGCFAWQDNKHMYSVQSNKESRIFLRKKRWQSPSVVCQIPNNWMIFRQVRSTMSKSWDEKSTQLCGD